MKTHYIIGPEIPMNGVVLKSGSEDVFIHGDGEHIVDITQLDISEDSRVIINAHGTHSGAKHQIRLKSSLGYACETDYTAYCFQDLSRATKGQAAHVELISCHGGYAINDVAYLPPHSTLMTFVDGEYSSLHSSMQIAKESEIMELKANPFGRFASYLLINADDTAFAIRGSNNNHIFSSKIEQIKDYSVTGIKEYQKTKILEYAEFLKSIDTNENNQRNIDAFINFTENKTQFNQWINSFDTKHYQQMLLLNAVHHGNIKIVNALLKEGVDSNVHPPLALAAGLGNIDIAAALLNNGAQIDQVDITGYTPLQVAAMDNKPEMVEFLLDRNAAVDQSTRYTEMTALHMAVKKEIPEITKILLERGADPNSMDYKQTTILQTALAGGEIKTVELLLEKGANPNQTADPDNSPLFMAAASGKIDLVKLLLSSGAVDEYVFEDMQMKEEINTEIKLFQKNPINYILSNNKTNTLKLQALNNLEKSKYFPDLRSENLKAIEAIQHRELISPKIIQTLTDHLTLIQEPRATISQVAVSKWERERLAKIAAQDVIKTRDPDARAVSPSSITQVSYGSFLSIAKRKAALGLRDK